MCNKTNMLVTESLGQEGAEDSLRGVTSMRRETRKPGTFGVSSTKGVEGRNVDSESGSVVQDLIKVGNQLVAEILSVTNNKGRKTRKKRFVVLGRIVVAVDELGKKGLAVDVEVAEL